MKIIIIGSPSFLLYIDLSDWINHNHDGSVNFSFITCKMHECANDYSLGFGLFGMGIVLQINK